MNTNRMPALVLAAVGVALIVAGPLLPGGERAVVNDPPRTGHVTDLARADDGSILVGTQHGELWRFADSTWGRIGINLDNQPVMSLSADLAADPRHGPIGTSGGLVNGPPALRPVRQRVSDVIITSAGLVVATGDGLLVQGDSTWRRQLAGVQVYRLGAQTVAGSDHLHAGTVNQGVFTAPVANLAAWSSDSVGLPEHSNVFTFAVTAGGRLIAGTDAGLYWQTAPMERWRPLRVGLEHDRMLSLYLQPAQDGQQRLWIGSDKHLYRVDLKEDDGGVEALAYAAPMAGPDDGLRYGVSWIVPFADGVMFSAGSVYQFGRFGFAGWYWVSLLGLLLLLLGGRLFPPPQQDTPARGLMAG
ncbi:MAG: hypothetical protein LJE69_01130 [Thiohalocapsa sp.]|jgi:hypothetical protein|uniref:hypothetical protein n=1 Tax=Thiohalocapsa sp. TaxID=2497641 RepID=UPI0025FB8AEF|nr:hypothetical protein [Thiohalocapsa sp.]MCG6939839.1 hypothetical protein [Thiohalocapsa sp.]